MIFLFICYVCKYSGLFLHFNEVIHSKHIYLSEHLRRSSGHGSKVKDGNVYEGRGWDTTGAHAGAEYNKNGLGVAMLGDFTSTMPTSKALQALNNLLACAITKKKLVANDYHVLGHRDIKATECPGDLFYANYVTRMPNYGLP
ncbi:hypothetical protein BSL78_25418 [Apostichopus japonicus]|uniref:Peptidoglycan recognition protein family domain-containing protein n=1 Tax=Stichopus japonicus TaxID=307972 RepID=A0A2G8JPY7_STIJA|nr:hypothetical protein BSL78_25418 [Apostichopus japonicus]